MLPRPHKPYDTTRAGYPGAGNISSRGSRCGEWWLNTARLLSYIIIDG